MPPGVPTAQGNGLPGHVAGGAPSGLASGAPASTAETTGWVPVGQSQAPLEHCL